MSSLLWDLLHDVFQQVSVHPIPIEICYGAQVCEETNALLVVITQTFSRGSDGKCTKCYKAEGDHHGSSKFCHVSTTSPCPPPHVHGFVLLSDACVIVT